MIDIVEVECCPICGTAFLGSQDKKGGTDFGIVEYWVYCNCGIKTVSKSDYVSNVNAKNEAVKLWNDFHINLRGFGL